MQFRAGIKAGGWENFTCNGCPRENFLKDLSLTFFLLHNTAIMSHTLAFHFAKSHIQNCFTSKSFEGSSSPNVMLCHSFSVLHSIILHLVTTIQGKTLIFCCKNFYTFKVSVEKFFPLLDLSLFFFFVPDPNIYLDSPVFPRPLKRLLEARYRQPSALNVNSDVSGTETSLISLILWSYFSFELPYFYFFFKKAHLQSLKSEWNISLLLKK